MRSNRWRKVDLGSLIDDFGVSLVADTLANLDQLIVDFGEDKTSIILRKLPRVYDTLSVGDIQALITSGDEAQADKLLAKVAREELRRSE